MIGPFRRVRHSILTLPRGVRSGAARWLFRPGSPKALAAWRITTNGWTLWYLAKRWRLITRTAGGNRRDFRPVGIARPLRRPLPVTAIQATTLANYAATVLAGLGVGYRVSGPLNSALTWWTLTYRNSWSMVFHNDNLAVLHSAVLGVSPAADAWAVDAAWRRHRGLGSPPAASWRHGWPVQTANAFTVVTYFVSGIAKVAGPLGWRWATGDHLRSQVAADGIRKSVLRPHTDGSASPPVAFLERHRRLWTVFAGGSLALELGAPLALSHPRIGRLWSGAAWSMHVGIKMIMRITFRYHLSTNPYVPFAFAPSVPTRP